MRWLLLLSFGCALENTLDKGSAEPAFSDGDSAVGPGADDTGEASVDEVCNGEDDDGDGTVDEGFADEDGNGRADCLDLDCPALSVGEAGPVAIDGACLDTGPVEDPWNVTLEWRYNAANHIYSLPVVGEMTDDDGDGDVDNDDVPDIAFVSALNDRLSVISGDGGARIFALDGLYDYGGVAIADVDGDGESEIVTLADANHVVAVDATGAVKWTSAALPLMSWATPIVADLDGDGRPEVIADAAILSGADGSTRATMVNEAPSFRTPIAADLDQDGTQEVILGGIVFAPDGTELWRNAGGEGFAAVLDVDGDPGGEVAFVTAPSVSFYDSDGTLLHQARYPGSGGIGGPPCVADFDGDGVVELAAPAETFLNVIEPDGTLLWSQPISDISGASGCSAFDLDGDGAAELLYHDEDDFYIFDGATGAVRFVDPEYSSGTGYEYPVVADVDNDGAAEIVVVGDYWGAGSVMVYGHAGAGWQPSGNTWGIHDYAVTNIGADGSIPPRPLPSWSTWNLFRSRPIEGTRPAANLAVAITDVCVADCDFGPVRVAFQAWNDGGVDVAAGATVELYADDGGSVRLVATVTLPSLPAGESAAGIEVELAPEDVGLLGFMAQVDPDDAIAECDEDDNVAAWSDVTCP